MDISDDLEVNKHDVTQLIKLSAYQPFVYSGRGTDSEMRKLSVAQSLSKLAKQGVAA